MTRTALSVKNLRVAFGKRKTQIVRGVSFDIAAGSTMVLLGESGSGKSVTAKAIMRLHDSTTSVSGDIHLGDVDLLAQKSGELGKIRGSKLAMIPQDPAASLDPLSRIGSQLAETIRRHGLAKSRADVTAIAVAQLEAVGISDATRVLRAFPHQLSGGMQQRILIALAVMSKPGMLIADEPTTALDVTVQAQVLALFKELVSTLDAGLLLVTHDVGVAREIADTVGVMYAGRMVEYGPADEVLNNPSHPYTKALLNSLPEVGMPRGSLIPIAGQPPAAASIPSGCAFAPRCAFATAACTTDVPPTVTVGPNHTSACILALENIEVAA